MIIGYFIDSTIGLNTKESNKIKSILCLITLLIFNQNLITNYYTNMQKYRYKAQKLREITYICEKEYLKKYNEGERNITITLPKKYEFYATQGDTFFNTSYINNVLKIDDTLNEIIFSDQILLDDFSQKELTELKFANIKEGKVEK